MPKGIPLTQRQKDLIVQLRDVEQIEVDLIAERLGLNKWSIINYMKIRRRKKRMKNEKG